MKTWVTISCLLLATPALAQSIEDAVDTTERGSVWFQFDAREGVRGNGHTITTDDDHYYGWSKHRGELTEGPVRVELVVRDGRIRDVDTTVGGPPPRVRDRDTDLGRVNPQRAVDFLLQLAREGGTGAAEDAILPASLARDVTVWPELLELARDRALARGMREQAIFLLGQFASETAIEGLGEIVDDDEEAVEVRKSAVFALSQRKAGAAVPRLIRVAKENRHPEVRESALFWLAQHDDPRVLDLFEEILIDR